MLATGGTIASSQGEQGLAPKLQTRELLDKIPAIREFCAVEGKLILQLDSSNMQPEDWKVMAEETYRGLGGFDGVVITHGTDTMAYTAAALSFLIQGLGKPVILTGSQIPMEQAGSDAVKNLADAFRVAACSGLAGVHIVFGGRIIRGCRAYKVSTRDFDAFRSINSPDVGAVEGDRIVLRALPATTGGSPVLAADLCADVLLLKLVPGTNPALLEKAAEMGYRGIVIESFGAGGVPFVRRNMLPALEAVIQKGVLVAVTTQCLCGGSDLSVYDVGLKTLEMGAVPCHDACVEAVVAKMMWVLGQTMDVREAAAMMTRNMVGEMTPPG